MIIIKKRYELNFLSILGRFTNCRKIIGEDWEEDDRQRRNCHQEKNRRRSRSGEVNFTNILRSAFQC